MELLKYNLRQANRNEAYRKDVFNSPEILQAGIYYVLTLIIRTNYGENSATYIQTNQR